MAESYSGEPEEAQTLAFASDYEGYSAILLTSPEYGCVEGQPRE